MSRPGRPRHRKNQRITEKDFWWFVEVMDYPNDRNEKRVSSFLSDSYNIGQIRALYCIYRKNMSRLMNRLVYETDLHVGDDGIRDCASWIIAHGKEAYESFMGDFEPEHIDFLNNCYEGFDYIWHLDDSESFSDYMYAPC